MCDIVLICLHFIVFGLKHDLLLFLIESQSFWLLIHLILSPNDVATLLFILICWVVFVVVFRDEFSTFCQSFVVVFVRERVTIRNPKTDSYFEDRFEIRVWRPRYGRRTRAKRERSKQGQRPSLEATCGTRPEVLSAHVCHTCPTWADDMAACDWSVFSLSFICFKFSKSLPFHFKKKN